MGSTGYCKDCSLHFVIGEDYKHSNHNTETCKQEDYDEPLDDD